MTDAANHPGTYKDKPLVELARELGYLVGAPIHYYAAVDLAGFRRLIDAAGGVTITNELARSTTRATTGSTGGTGSDSRLGATRSTAKMRLPSSALGRLRPMTSIALGVSRKCSWRCWRSVTNRSMLPRIRAADRGRGRHSSNELPVRPSQRRARPCGGHRCVNGQPGRSRAALIPSCAREPGRWRLLAPPRPAYGGGTLDQGLRGSESTYPQP